MGIAVMTIVTGAFGALIKDNIRRLFAYLIVCHLGYVIGGLGLYTQTAFLGAVFYLIHDIVVKTNLFLITGLLRQLRGSMNLSKLGGLYAQYPKLSILIGIVLFSLAGVPPLSGFWPKIYLIKAAYTDGNYLFIAAIIFGSFITLYLMARIWSEVFWKEASSEAFIEDKFEPLNTYKKVLLVLPVCFLAFTSLYIGLNAEMIIQTADRIADEMADTSFYIEAVLGKR